MTRLIPWPVLAVLMLIAGILCAYLGLSWFWLAALCLVGIRVYKLQVGAIVLVCLPLGYYRYHTWQNQSDPFQGLYGQTLSLSGHSDGQYLRLDEPKGARLVLSPRGILGPGKVTLLGEIRKAQGKQNPGGFDYQGYLRRRNVWAQVKVEELISFVPSLGAKERLRQGVVAGLDKEEAALMQAMTLGVRDELDGLRSIFAASGLAHVLALSGLHVGVLLLGLSLCLRPLGIGRYSVLMVIIVGFVVLVGPSPSVLRASTMSVAALIYLHLGAGRIKTWASLGLSALGILLYMPSWLFDVSFQLSYLSVMGLLICTKPILQRVLGKAYHRLPWWHPKIFLVASFIVSFCAQILTYPLIAEHFSLLPLFSGFVNVLAIPLASVLVPLGFLSGLLGLLSLKLAALLNGLIADLATSLIGLAQWGAKLPSLIWGEVSWHAYGLYYLACLAFVFMLYNYVRLWQTLVVIATCLGCSMLLIPPRAPPDVVFLDVGQGDSVLIRLPHRQEILLDGGGTPFSDFDVGARVVVPALRALDVDELEVVLASHTDADHIEGLIAVLNQVPVRELIIGLPSPGEFLFDELIAVAEQKNIPVRQVRRGESLFIGEAELDFLNPPNKAFAEENDNSLAFVLRYRGQAKALFLGDISSVVEARLAFPKVDILMAAHHGSKTSTSEALLRATKPEHVVLSYGYNVYGHPHETVIDRIKQSGAKIHEPHKQGAVFLPLD